MPSGSASGCDLSAVQDIRVRLADPECNAEAHQRAQAKKTVAARLGIVPLLQGWSHMRRRGALPFSAL